MRQLNGVELAIKRLASGVTLHCAEQGDQRGGEGLYLRALCGGKMSQDIRRGESSWRPEHTLQACKHLVREPSWEHAAHTGGGHSAAHDRCPLLYGSERLRAQRRRQRGADPGSRALPSPLRPGGAPAADLYGDVLYHRVHRRALDLLLRRHVDAAGDGTGRLDVRRHRPLHRPRGQR